MNAPTWKAGAASVAITPAEAMWLAGWAARREPANGKAMELFAKALALEDADGERLVIVTADLIAIPRDLANAVAARVHRHSGVARERMLFNASHTHTGPEVRPDKVPFFEIPAEFAARIAPYVSRVEQQLLDLITTALERLEAVTLRVHQTRVTFAVNRRGMDGGVDHDVPILVVERDTDRAPVAILFGYACHNLTLPPTFCEYHGDYAGVAQVQLEQKFPGAIALFLSGAGADQDPAPRGTLELVQQHGHVLANEVAEKLSSRSRKIAPRLRVAFEEISLGLQPLPSRAQLDADLASDDRPRRRKASFLLTAIDAHRPLATELACPIHVIQLGRELLLIALGGEPVAEFAARFKSVFAGPCVWVAGYSNDMFGYLPTRRVQQAGGYEGGRASLWSAVTTPLDETAEERVVAAVQRLVAGVRTRRAKKAG